MTFSSDDLMLKQPVLPIKMLLKTLCSSGNEILFKNAYPSTNNAAQAVVKELELSGRACCRMAHNP